MKEYFHNKIFMGIGLFVFIFAVNGQAQVLRTPAEEAGYGQYSQHEAIARFLSYVDYLSENVNIQVIGKTGETGDFAPRDIYLCIITEEGAANPGTLNWKKPTIMLIASQHGNEQSGKEAALWLIRDIALGDLKPLLKKVNFIIIPQANPYGNWRDQRDNEESLDMNRDHVKLETEGVAALHRVFKAWMPEITLDVHEKGDDYYRVSIGCVSNINIHPRLLEFSRKKILAEVGKNLEKKRLTFQEYLVSQEIGLDSSAGVRYSTEELANREMMKRFSTTDLNDGRNSFGIYETLSFIQEGASRHDLKTLRERTRWQYFGIRYFMEVVAGHAEESLTLVNTLRRALQEKAGTYSEQDPVYLRMEYVRDPANPELVIKKFERTERPARGVLKSDKKAGDVLTMEDIAPLPYPSRYKVVTEVIKDWFPVVEPRLSVSRPLGYVIPAGHRDVVETLLSHGISVETFTRDQILDVEAYTTTDVVPASYDYLSPDKIEVEKKVLQTVIKKDDFYVSCAQDAANLIPCLLEPQSDYGLIRYWKYHLVPEKENLFAFYRIVKSQGLPLVPYRNWSK
ncbi:MAG: M14 family zinc carboxypeptidase [Candidatus Aminicenantales bacterium]